MCESLTATRLYKEISQEKKNKEEEDEEILN
jgi:hypothetical protein